MRKLEEAGDNARKLLNLRKRMARISVFDPACGSGNFLVIAYKEMRAIEAEINKRRGEADRRIRDSADQFSRHRTARLSGRDRAPRAHHRRVPVRRALSRPEAGAGRDFLPLDAQNWITCGNALRLDWLSICPPTGTGVKHHADDLFNTPLDQAQIDFENEGGETYICGNPPYHRQQMANKTNKKLTYSVIFDGRTDKWKSLDYVSGWFMKAADYRHARSNASAAFVATNSICQGQQVPILWPLIFQTGHADCVRTYVIQMGKSRQPQCRRYRGHRWNIARPIVQTPNSRSPMTATAIETGQQHQRLPNGRRRILHQKSARSRSRTCCTMD